MNVNWIGPTIMKYGSEEQKSFHLPKIAAGSVLWCQGFSEPEAGSDLVSLRTAATRSGDDYVVNGSKIWTSYVAGAEYCFLLVRTDPNSKRHHGISVLLARMDAPGITVREVPAVIGERYFHELFFDDARIPASCRIWPQGEGWGVVSYALAFEPGAQCAMRAPRSPLDARSRKPRASADGLEDPVIQEKLGAARNAVEASRRSVPRDHLRAKGSEPTADTNIARVAGTLCENAVSDLALEIYGARGARVRELRGSYWGSRDRGRRGRHHRDQPEPDREPMARSAAVVARATRRVRDATSASFASEPKASEDHDGGRAKAGPCKGVRGFRVTRPARDPRRRGSLWPRRAGPRAAIELDAKAGWDEPLDAALARRASQRSGTRRARDRCARGPCDGRRRRCPPRGNAAGRRAGAGRSPS